MPGLDVSEAVTDPMLADRFDVTRRTQVVGDNGRASITPQVFKNIVGVVTAAGGNDLMRLDDNQRMGNNYVVITKFRLQGPAPGFQPDYIKWEDDDYIVKDIDDYSRYGAGFIQAIIGSVESIDNPAHEAGT